MRSSFLFVPTLLPLLSLACTGDTESPPAALQVDTLANGAVHRRYSARPEVPVWRLEEEVRLGAGPTEKEIFGSVQGLELSPDGEILVLDYQATEIRRYSWEGEYLETVVSRGAGPREIRGANGMMYGPEGILWINDYGNSWRILGLEPGGGVRTVRSPTLSRGYVWQGGVTEDGWIRDWRPHPVDGERAGPRSTPGVHETPYALYLNGTNGDQASAGRQEDSVVVQIQTSRSIRFPRGSMGVPADPRPVTALDPRGYVWTGVDAEYRLTKQSLEGDTLTVVSVPAEAEPLTSSGRDSVRERMEGFMERAGKVSLPWDEILPSHHAVLRTITVDDQGRLWVLRRLPGDSLAYDVLDSGGRLLAEVRPTFRPLPFHPPRIRGDRFLAVVTDELDVQYVIGARIIPD